MFFYVSIRPVNIDGKRILTPKYALNDSFPGIIKSWKCLSRNTNEDGRWMYEVEVDTEEQRDIVVEGLAMWGCHLKTKESAINLFKILTKREDHTFKDDKLIIPMEDKKDGR